MSSVIICVCVLKSKVAGKIVSCFKQLRASSCGSQLEMTRWKCFVKLFNYLNVNIVKSFHLRFVNSSHECHFVTLLSPLR